MNLEKFFKGSRKFTVMTLLIVVPTILRITRLLESPDYASILSTVGVAFMGSNAVEKVTTAAHTWLLSKGQTNGRKED